MTPARDESQAAAGTSTLDAAGAVSVVQVVLMTAPSADVAEHVVRTLVDERLAACGNIVPGMTSIYRWQGAVRTDAEVLVILKTTAERAAALLARASALHPYDVPELLVLPVAAGHEPYLAWVRSCSVAGAGT